MTIQRGRKDESAYGERLGLLYCGVLHSLETEAASCKKKQAKNIKQTKPLTFDRGDGGDMEKSSGFKFSMDQWHSVSSGDTVLVGISGIGSSSPRDYVYEVL